MASLSTDRRYFLFQERAYTALLIGVAVAQLIEALRYKSEGRGFDSRWYHWNFFIDIILPNDCLKEEATSYKMQRPSHNQPYRTYSEDSSKDT